MREFANLLIAVWYKISLESKAIEKQNILDDVIVEERNKDNMQTHK